MTVLILDTCVWIDLAVSHHSLITKIAQLVDTGKATIVVPEPVRTEWDRLKRKKVTERILRDAAEDRRSAMKFASLLDDEDDLSKRISAIDSETAASEVAADRINAIEELLNSGAQISVPDSAKFLAVDHALQKKAPFRLKNGMADALIFFTTVDWVNSEAPNAAVFVTHNTKDFSDEKRSEDDAYFTERLSPDLQPFTNGNGLKYGVFVGRVLNEIEEATATEEEIEREEAVVQIRLGDDALADMLEFQRKLDAIMRLPADEFAELQRTIAQSFRTPGDEVLEHARKMQEALRRPLDDFAKQARKMQETLRRPLDDLANQGRKMQQILRTPADDLAKELGKISYGPFPEMVEQQRRVPGVFPRDPSLLGAQQAPSDNDEVEPDADGKSKSGQDAGDEAK